MALNLTDGRLDTTEIHEATGVEEPLRLTVATPYAEGAVMAIARCAAARGQLDRFCTTLYLRDCHASRVISRGLARRRLSGIPSATVWRTARGTELIRLAACRMASRKLATSSMYRTKERFDGAVASEVRHRRSTVVVAMMSYPPRRFSKRLALEVNAPFSIS